MTSQHPWCKDGILLPSQNMSSVKPCCFLSLKFDTIKINSRRTPSVEKHFFFSSWWRHQIETFSALLAICAGNSPASGEFPAQRPVTRSFDVSCGLCLNKQLRKQLWGWWFEMLLHPSWRHCNVATPYRYLAIYGCSNYPFTDTWHVDCGLH